MSKVKVLYITGWGRSGSTILNTILGQIDGFFAVGELYRIIKWNSMVGLRDCGCGARLGECQVWASIFDRAFGGMREIIPFQIPRLLLPSAGTKLNSVLEDLAQLYSSIQDITGCKVIVDSSKYPLYGHLLRRIPEINLYNLHLVRDPQAVAYSWRRIKRHSDTGHYMRRKNILESTIQWSTRNLEAELLCKSTPERYLRISYESFTDQPKRTVSQILTFASEKVERLPFVTPGCVEIRPTHTVVGNPGRFKTGMIELKEDDEWKNVMKPRTRKLIVMLTWPLLHRYGYR